MKLLIRSRSVPIHRLRATPRRQDRVMSTNEPHTPDVNPNHHQSSDVEQLTLDGFADPRDGLDPRFILSDETCRIGRRYLAEMRRILAEGRARAAERDTVARAA
jgi:hypothetical protein